MSLTVKRFNYNGQDMLITDRMTAGYLETLRKAMGLSPNIV